MVVYITNLLLIIANIINLVKLFNFDKLIDLKVLRKIIWIFYYALSGVFVNIIQTLYTLFGPYLDYFECILYFNE